MANDSRSPAERLAAARAVLTQEERAVLDAVCGKTQSLRASCRETGMGRKKLERILKQGLDKLIALRAIEEGAAVAGSTALQ